MNVFIHTKKLYEKLSFTSLTQEQFEKFSIFYKDYKTKEF